VVVKTKGQVVTKTLEAAAKVEMRSIGRHGAPNSELRKFR
jgi:hypothetical protein